ncbi:MAG: hypothetical protein Q9169_001048 [Polycauliona sp. 2 TL-2023]
MNGGQKTLALSIKGVHPGNVLNNCTGTWFHAAGDSTFVDRLNCTDAALDVGILESKQSSPEAADITVWVDYTGLKQAKWNINTGDTTTWSCASAGSSSCTVKQSEFKIEDHDTPRTREERAGREAEQAQKDAQRDALDQADEAWRTVNRDVKDAAMTALRGALGEGKDDRGTERFVEKERHLFPEQYLTVVNAVLAAKNAGASDEQQIEAERTAANSLVRS